LLKLRHRHPAAYDSQHVRPAPFTTGVAIPTVKYYLREGLLARGDATAPNQAEYGSAHAHRLRLIRVLREVGGLTVGRVAAVLAAIDDAELPRQELFGVTQRALAPPSAAPVSAEVTLARAEIDSFLADRGWQVSAAAVERLVVGTVVFEAALAALRRLAHEHYSGVRAAAYTPGQ
jgi:DNA-binding transcriptional MerR regulator